MADSERAVWRSKEEQALAKGLSMPSIDYPDIIKRFLLAREILSTSEIEAIFNPKLAQLTDPYTILGMKKAVDRIFEAFNEKQKICIYADFDLDGTSGLALLYYGLKDLGFEQIEIYQPKRLSEGYGFHPHAIEELAEKGVSLVITVDVGITAYAACEVAAKKNLDVIITDHHQPGQQLPLAKVVINPNQRHDESGLGYLCGAGVAFYLLRALNRHWVQSGLLKASGIDLKSLLDFLAIGTLTDMVPLVQDNRALVRQGLVALEKTNRPGLRALLRSLNLDGQKLNSQDVGIRFAPKLNALSRMEQGVLPIDIFLIEDEDKAQDLIEVVLSNNADRVSQQRSGEEEAQELLKNWVDSDFVFVHSKKFHRGIIGLIATKLAQNFGVPAFVGSENDEGLIVGSSRVPSGQGYSVLNALESGAGFLNRHGGHHSAAGFELHAENAESFVQALRSFFASGQSKVSPVIEYDLDMQLESINENLLKWIDSMNPFGQGFANPLFRLSKVKVKKAHELKGGHLKLSLIDDGQSQKQMDALLFSPSAEQKIDYLNQNVEMLVEPQWNYFAGKSTVQLLVKDLRIL